MDDSQIDPQILNEENNPALRFLRRLQDNPRPSNAVSSDPPDLDSDPEDAIPLNPSTGVPSGNSLVQFGRIFKRHMKLTVESETDFDNFCSVRWLTLIGPSDALKYFFRTHLPRNAWLSYMRRYWRVGTRQDGHQKLMLSCG